MVILIIILRNFMLKYFGKSLRNLLSNYSFLVDKIILKIII
jgi:hypothetical protein